MDNFTEIELDIRKKIDAYLNGEMTIKEQDDFWDLVIGNPEVYNSLKVESSLRILYKNKLTNGNGDKTTQKENEKFESESNAGEPEELYNITPMSHYKNWIIAIAAVIVLVVGINLFKINSPTSPANRVHLLSELHTLDSIDLFAMESMDTVRGESGEEDPFAFLFDRSLISAFSEEPNEALKMYEDLIARFPDDPRIGKAFMNAGILLYNMEDYEKASEFFGEAITKVHDDRSQERAWWFKANAELVAGNYEMARYSFHMTFGFDGVYRREAFRQLRILDAYLGYIDFQDIEPEVIDP